jgi:hypothetical protein
MHSPFSFARLAASRQADYLFKRGFYVSERSTRRSRFRLYSLHYYYVETCSDTRSDALICLYPLPLDLVEAYYAAHISLETLLH